MPAPFARLTRRSIADRGELLGKSPDGAGFVLRTMIVSTDDVALSGHHYPDETRAVQPTDGRKVLGS